MAHIIQKNIKKHDKIKKKKKNKLSNYICSIEEGKQGPLTVTLNARDEDDRQEIMYDTPYAMISLTRKKIIPYRSGIK